MFDKTQWKALRARALEGDSDAQWEIGSCYAKGVFDTEGKAVVRKNVGLASRWLGRSAEQDNPWGQVSPGVVLSSGRGVPPDLELALYWTKRAPRKGAAIAAYNIGTIYRDMGEYRKAYQ